MYMDLAEVKYVPIVSVQSTHAHTSRENRIHFKRLHSGTAKNIKYYIVFQNILLHFNINYYLCTDRQG